MSIMKKIGGSRSRFRIKVTTYLYILTLHILTLTVNKEGTKAIVKHLFTHL